MMYLSPEGAALIQHFEDCKTKAYPDPGSELGLECRRRRIAIDEYDAIVGWDAMDGDPWTIGWGHTGSDVYPGLSCTKDEADRWFDADVFRFVHDVNSLLGATRVTQNEFDALVSFAYNCGSDIDSDDIAEGLGDSTLLRLLKNGDIGGAANEFPKWNKSNGRVTPGLVRRRAAERAMFLGQDWRAAAGIH
jgi:lysozyme